MNLFLHVHASCTHCEKLLMIFLYTIKLFVKSGNTQHRKPIFGLFMKHNFKYSTKKIHIDPMGHETQISSKTQHELNFMLNFLPVHYPNKPAFRPLTSMLALHCLCLLTSHVYLNVHTLIIEACINSKVSQNNLLFLSPFFLSFMLSYMRLLLFLLCKLLAHRFGTHDHLMLGLLFLVY